MDVLLHRCRTARLVPAAHLHISYAKDILEPVYDRFTEGFCDCGHADRASPARHAPAVSSVTLICWREIDRTDMQIEARPDKRRIRVPAKSQCRQVRQGAWR